MEYEKPLPEKALSGVTEPFWEAAQDERLIIQFCQDCQQFFFRPRVLCPYCRSRELEWRESDGNGTVYTYTVIHHPPDPAWEDDVPYANAFVQLWEDVYIFSSIVNCSPEEVRVGMPVSVTFDHVTEDITLPKFEPRDKS